MIHEGGQDDPTDIFDDLDKLKADSAVPPQPGPAPRGWRRYGTTVPREWEMRLRRATRISTYRLAHELLYRKWQAEQGRYGRKSEPVIVSSDVVTEAGISTRSMWNALDQLKQLGLVTIAHGQGRAPRATLLHIPDKPARRLGST